MNSIYRMRSASLNMLHERLLAAYKLKSPGGWAYGADDGYFFGHLPWYLRAARRDIELDHLLVDFY